MVYVKKSALELRYISDEATALQLPRSENGQRRRQLLGSLENAKLLAGGQSLMPMLNFRFVQPDHIIDLNRVEGLSYIRETGGMLEIGAMTRQRDLEFSDVVKARWPIMHEALLQVGHRQTRNRGTIGGSLCHLDPQRSSCRSRPVTTRP
jgi:CO/xanthine dehydrogenase FAD-binding subunit